MVSQYEPRAIYEDRTRRVASYLQSARSAMPSPTAPVQEQPWWRKGLSTTFDYMGRPLAATSSALAAGLRGEDMGLGFMQGLRGQGEIKSIEDVLRQQGMPGGWQRKTLGFLGSAVVDPWTWATWPVGAGGSALMRGVRAATPGLAKGIEATPALRGLVGAGPTAREAQPIETVVRSAFEEAQQPLRGREALLAKPSDIPGIGGIYKSLMSVFNPKIAARNDPIARARVAMAKIGDQADPIVQGLMAPLRLQARQGGVGGVGMRDIFNYSAEDGGVILLAGGKPVPARWALSDEYAAQWTPEQRAFVDTFRRQNEPLYQLARDMGVNFTEYDLPEAAGYFPGMVDMEATSRYRRRVGLTVPGTLRERSIKTPEAARKAGIIYTDPVQSAEWHFKGLIMAIANAQLAKQLEPLARRQNLALIAGAKGAAVAAGTRVGAAESLRLMVQRVRRGEVPTQGQIKAVAKGFPELQGQLEAAMELGPREFEQSLTVLADDVQAALGVTPQRLMQAIRDAQFTRTRTGFDVMELSEPWQMGTADYPLRNVSRVDVQQAIKDIGKEDKTSLNLIEDIYRNAYRLNKDERANALQAVADSVEAEKATLKGEAQVAGEAYRGIRAQEAAAVEGRRAVQDLPAFKEQWFTPEDAQQIEDAFLPPVSGTTRAKAGAALGLGQDLSSVMRTTMSGADMSAPMIQGLLALARRPSDWMGSFRVGMQALFDPQTHARLLAGEEAQRARQLIPNLYFSKGGGEFFAGIRPAQRALHALPVVGRPLAAGVEQIYGRGAAAFDAVGDYLRVRQGLPLAEMAQRYGRDMMEVGELVNKMTGVASVSGLPPNWSKFESGMLLFAPRYTRSSMALVLDAMTRGDMVGSEARATLAQTLGFGLAWYMKVAELAGEEAHLDPSKSNFLSVKIGGDVVGIGSIWVSMAKLLARVAQDPTQAVPSNWDELTKDNPITQWWRGRGSPVGAMLYDKLIAGEDFIGAPLDTPIDLAYYMGGKLTPFAVSSYLVQSGQRPGVESLPGQLAGLRTFPAPKAEWRETVAQEMYQRPYAELDPVAQAKVEQDPRVKNIPAKPGERGERQRALGEIYDTYNNNISKLADDVASNRRTKNQFRLAISGLNHDRSIRLESVPERKVGGTRQPTAQEAARKQYYDIMGQLDEENKPNFEGAESFLAGLPSSYVAYIEQKEMAGIERLPENARELMRERLEARRVTAPYWDLQDTILKKYGIDTTGMSPAEQLAMQDTPRYKAAIKEVKAKREQMRRQNPAIERAISEWYGRVALAARRR